MTRRRWSWLLYWIVVLITAAELITVCLGHPLGYGQSIIWLSAMLLWILQAGAWRATAERRGRDDVRD